MASLVTNEIYAIARFMAHHRIRGGDRLINILKQRNVIADCKLGNGVTFNFPIGRTENYSWGQQEWQQYESDLITTFCNAIRGMNQITLLDCGADLGIFSALVCSRTTCIRNVIAFEPNATVSNVLRQNISALPNGRIITAAVSDVSGSARLEMPTYYNSDHARYIVQSEDGLPVITIDSIESSAVMWR